MKEAGVTGCIKHFPGHGDTKNDTHYGYAQTLKTWDQMLDCELIPFKAGIAWGCKLVMSAHIACPNVTGSEIPSTMSSLILQDKLRGELGYENLIITDAMEMGAITQQYSPEGATLGCVQAGVDLVLGPKDFTRSFNALVKAVEEGKISEDRIDESVKRILKVKYNL
jgi:beta-N-acetylhexosaminidase